MAQSLLDKKISVQANNKSLGDILESIEEKGGFRFSYNSNSLSEDSLLSISAYNQKISEVLDLILSENLEYIETGNYIVLRRKRTDLAFVFQDISHKRNAYFVRGYLINPKSGQRVAEASVYEKHLLLSDLSDKNGVFKFKIADNHKSLALTASKALYADTTMVILLEAATVTADRGSRDGEKDNDFTGERDSNSVERTALGRFFLSSRQRIQSLNLRGFITQSPVQMSLTPGLSTHGMMSAQVVNKFSVNFLGGYTAGVDGVEMAGVFNINKKNMQFVQAAGVFNTVGGKVRGMQLAGVFNVVLNSVKGLQVAGAYNRTDGEFSGMQLSALYNHVEDTVKGLQVSGGINRADGDMSGAQVSALFNKVAGDFNGFQITGLGNLVKGDVQGLQVAAGFNYAKNLKGVQFALVNIAERSSGYSIGLLNIIKENGYRKLVLSASETFPLNLALKTGTSKFYTILQVAAKPGKAKLYAYGLGFGKEIKYSPKFSLQPELRFLNVYQGSSDYSNNLIRLDIGLSYKLSKHFRVFAEPSVNIFYSNQEMPVEGYAFIPNERKHHFSIGNSIGWIGWNFGVSLF